MSARVGEYGMKKKKGSDWWLGLWYKIVDDRGDWHWLNGDIVDPELTPWDGMMPGDFGQFASYMFTILHSPQSYLQPRPIVCIYI